MIETALKIKNPRGAGRKGKFGGRACKTARIPADFEGMIMEYARYLCDPKTDHPDATTYEKMNPHILGLSRVRKQLDDEINRNFHEEAKIQEEKLQLKAKVEDLKFKLEKSSLEQEPVASFDQVKIEELEKDKKWRIEENRRLRQIIIQDNTTPEQNHQEMKDNDFTTIDQLQEENKKLQTEYFNEGIKRRTDRQEEAIRFNKLKWENKKLTKELTKTPEQKHLENMKDPVYRKGQEEAKTAIIKMVDDFFKKRTKKEVGVKPLREWLQKAKGFKMNPEIIEDIENIIIEEVTGEKVDELQQEINRLNKHLTSHSERRWKAEKGIESLQAEIKQLNQKFINEVAVITVETKQLKLQKKKAEKKIELLQKEINRFRKELGKSDKQLDIDNIPCDQAEEIERLEAENMNLKYFFEQRGKERDDTAKQNKQLRKDLSSKDQLISRIKKLENTIKDKDLLIEQLKIDLKDITSRFVALQDDQVTKNKKIDKINQALQGKVDKDKDTTLLKQEIKVITDTKKAFERQFRGSEVKREYFQNRVRALEAKIADNNPSEILEVLTVEINKLKKENKSLADLTGQENWTFRPLDKLFNAGFRVLRVDDSSKRIKEMTGKTGGWNVIEKDFSSKTAMEKRFRELMDDPKTIQG